VPRIVYLVSALVFAVGLSIAHELSRVTILVNGHQPNQFF